ncbi:hypothetical protein KY346_06705 [Candidatus Woesearchaeota archaeon]|nr:hypothetical protein [Candidatus Woesearchaeota archaeon]
MAETQLLIKEFPKTVARHCNRPKASISEIAETADLAMTERQDAERIGKQETRDFLKKQQATLDKLLGYYFVSSLSQEYPLISKELFTLKRYLAVRNGVIVRDDSEKTSVEDAETITIPLFAYTKLFTDHTVKLGESVHIGSRTQRTTRITAKLPGEITEDLRYAAKRALSFYHSILEQAYQEHAISDLLLHKELEKPELGALWIPTLSSLEVETEIKELPAALLRDPALVLTAMDRKYLIKTWDAQDDKRFERYLQQFSKKGLD